MKIGDVVIVKTTGEPVVILESGTEPVVGFFVRRPVFGDKGEISHVREFFLAFELETEEERTVRFLEGRKTRKAMEQSQDVDDADQPGPELISKKPN